MISYRPGDATQPMSRPAVIVHVCNDIGGWGAGFVLAVSRRWKEPERIYRASFRSSSKPSLGDVQFIDVEPGLTVANMIAQRGIGPAADGSPPIRYTAVRTCLEKVATYATERRASVHMPRIGCGLAGGRWDDVEAIVQATLVGARIPTIVYDFAAQAPAP